MARERPSDSARNPPLRIRLPARSPELALGWIAGVQLVLMSALAAVLGTWQDEEYTLATTARGVGYAIHRAIGYELQAPLYFALLAALRSLNGSMLFARMFSVLCACALSLLAARIARRVWPARDPRYFVLLVAFNPFVVYAALEIRLYAFALLLSAALWLAFDAGYLAQERSSARIALVVLAIAASYVQYFLTFELVGFAVALVVAGRRRACAAYLASMVPVALAFAPMALVLRSQIGASSEPASRAGGWSAVLVHPLLDFVLPLDYAPLLGRAAHAIVAGLLVVVVVLVFLGRPRPSARTRALVAIAVTVEACYAVVADMLHYELVAPRHFVALFVPEAAAAYAVLAAFRGPRALRSAAALACMAAIAAAASLLTDYRTLAKQGDWPRVGALLGAAARPGDTIAVFEADGVAPLRRYYDGAAHIVPFPREPSAVRYRVDALLVHSEPEAAAALAALPQNGRLWLVYFGACTALDSFGCGEVRAAIAKHYRILEHHSFFRNEVWRLAPRDGTVDRLRRAS